MTPSRWPDFFILGAAKSGTTSLYSMGAQHPEIFLPLEKEPMFFSRDDNFNRGIDWYSRTFFSKAKKHQVSGDATPHYLYWSTKVAERMAHSLDKAAIKFIVILRNPVERAYSWYWNMVAEGREDIGFYQALLTEQDQLAKHWRSLMADGSMQYGYVRGGQYASQLTPFLAEFSRDQFLILLYEDLINDQSQVAQQMFQFLGVSSHIDLQVVHRNTAALPRSSFLQSTIRNPSLAKQVFKSLTPYPVRVRVRDYLLSINRRRFEYPPMAQREVDFLISSLGDEINALEKMIDRDLSHWFFTMPELE